MNRKRTWTRVGMSAALLVGGSTFMNTGCSPEVIRALIIGLDAAAGQIEEDNRDVRFSDWLHSELDDIF